MNFLKTLSTLEDLTVNEVALRDRIIEDPVSFIQLKPKEMAQKAYVSVSTIYRLVDKLGLNGINALKLELARALRDEPEERIPDVDFPILESDSHYNILHNLKALYSQTLEEYLLLSEPDVLVDIGNAMVKASAIDVYTASANVYFAENFRFQMQEIGVMIQVPVEDYMQRLCAANSDPSHLAIVMSYGGRSQTTREVMRILKENGVPIVLITSTQGNELASGANTLLYLPSFEHHTHKVSSFSTRLSLLFTFDLLYAVYFQKAYEDNLNFKQSSYRKLNPSLK